MHLLPFALKPERLEAETRSGSRLFDGKTQAGFDQLPKRKTPAGAVLARRAKQGIGNFDRGLHGFSFPYLWVIDMAMFSEVLRDII